MTTKWTLFKASIVEAAAVSCEPVAEANQDHAGGEEGHQAEEGGLLGLVDCGSPNSTDVYWQTRRTAATVVRKAKTVARRPGWTRLDELKALDEVGLSWLFNIVWESGTVPGNFKNGTRGCVPIIEESHFSACLGKPMAEYQ